MNLPYQYLIDISTVISYFVIFFVFLSLFESRYPKKKYLASLIPFLILWCGGNIGVLFFLGIETLGKITFFTATIPSLIYFWIAAKNRDGRFLFTFCLVDTVMLWVLSMTGIVDIFMGNTGFYTFLFRMLLFPVIIFVFWRIAQKPYIRLLHTVHKGWWLFSAMTGLFYVSLTIMLGIPTNLRMRPEDVPATIMVLMLLPLTYITIFRVLSQQQQLFESSERQHLLEIQTAMVEQRVDEFKRMDEKIRIERHDLRHRFQMIYTMLQNGQPQNAMDFIADCQNILNETIPEHYCTHPILDATLSAYLQQAKDMGISITTQLAIPDTLPVPAAELSIVFANAIENMINAVSKLPPENRHIIIKCVYTPHLIIEFANPCADTAALDENGLPIVQDAGHGIGTRSIIAFTEKYHALYSFRIEDGWFKLQLAL